MRISDVVSIGMEALIFAVAAGVFFAVVWAVFYKIVYKKLMHGKKQISIGKMAWICIFAVYILAVLFVTLFRGKMGYAGIYNGMVNWKPFSSYKDAWYKFSMREWRNLILNICMFIPFGFLLPLCFNRIDRAWKTYICGFLLTLFIEVTQLITGRGVFEADDIINNTLGAMIGYGILSMFRLIADVLSVKINDKKNITVRPQGRNCILAQIPLIVTIAAFGIVFAIYNNKEYGNLYLDNIEKHPVNVSLSDSVELSDEADALEVYTVHRATEEETRKLAEAIFSKYDTQIDEAQTQKYDDTIIYYSKAIDDDGNSLSAWCDYEGPTISITDFSLIEQTVDEEGKDLGFKEEEVRSKLEKLGVVVPQNAVFKEESDYSSGSYSFTDEGELLDDGLYYKGKIECRLVPSGGVEEISDEMIKYTPYKKADVISPKEAYDKLCQGKFYYSGDDGKTMDIVVKSVNISYEADSKGYYRPVYEFNVQVDGNNDDSILIDAMAG